jgi:hypothetical protein
LERRKMLTGAGLGGYESNDTKFPLDRRKISRALLYNMVTIVNNTMY